MWEATERTIGKTGTGLVVELKMIIKVEGMEHWGNKHSPTNMPQSNDRESYTHRIEKHQ